MTKTEQYIAEAIQAIVLNENDRAIGLLMRATLTFDDDVVPEPKELPEITYTDTQRPPRSTSVDVSCPTCSARKGQPCFTMDRRGPNSNPTTEVAFHKDGSYRYHKPRVRKAKEQS